MARHDIWMSVAEVALLWGVHRRTVLRRIHDGSLRARRLPGGGHQYRVRYRDAVKALTPPEGTPPAEKELGDVVQRE